MLLTFSNIAGPVADVDHQTPARFQLGLSLYKHWDFTNTWITRFTVGAGDAPKDMISPPDELSPESLDSRSTWVVYLLFIEAAFEFGQSLPRVYIPEVLHDRQTHKRQQPPKQPYDCVTIAILPLAPLLFDPFALNNP